MKKISYFLAVALVAGFLSSCANLAAPSMGHLAISVPLSSSSKGLAKSISDVSYIRVYVVLNGSFVQQSGKDYLEQTCSGEGSSYSIDLSPSAGYKVYTVLGNKDASGLWVPKYYGGTDSFTVSSGVYTKKTIEVAALATNFSSFAAASSAVYSVSVGSSLWRVVGGKLTDGSTSVDLPSGATVYSLTAGQWFSGSSFASEPWLNTSSGIYTVKDGSLLQRSSSIAATYTGAITVQLDSSSSTLTLVVFYYGSDIGYAMSSDSASTSTDKWTNKNGLSAYMNTSAGAYLKNLISDTSTFAKSMTFVPNGKSTYGFASTAVGTYLYNAAMMDVFKGKSESEINAWVSSQFKSSDFAVGLYNGGKIVIPSSLALDANSSGLAASHLYLGTDAGLYWSGSAGIDFGGLSSASTVSSALTSLGTSKVVKLVAVSFGDASYAAYVDSTGLLTILKNGASYASYPFYAYTAEPSNVTGLSFFANGTSLQLAISSSDGFALLNL